MGDFLLIVLLSRGKMNETSQCEKHALNLGKLTGNLLTIEMAARMAIVKHDDHAASCVFTQLPQIREGDLVECNAYTNSNDLRQTLQKYNKQVHEDYNVDVTAIVNLRDALAHGRMFGYGDKQNLMLLKFNRKKHDGKVLVELAQEMTNVWFSDSIEMLIKATEKVAGALDYEKKELS